MEYAPMLPNFWPMSSAANSELAESVRGRARIAADNGGEKRRSG